MEPVETEFLFEMDAELETNIDVGATPYGHRMVAYVSGGRFEGPKLKGEVLPGGGDWALIRADGVIGIDVRACLKADNGDVIYVTYGGRLAVPGEIAPKAFNRETADEVDPSAYYFRTTPLFQTGSETFGWLNSVVAVGVGRLTGKGVSYSVHAIK